MAKNSYFEYVSLIFNDKKLTQNLNSTRSSSLGKQKLIQIRTSEKGKYIKKKMSYFRIKFEENIYKNQRYLKYSKQFINTTTIAFMIIYFFTIYGIKFASGLSSLLTYFLDFIFKLMFSDFVSFKEKLKGHFEFELKLTVCINSILILIQLLLTIRKFHSDLIKLHKGRMLFTFLFTKKTWTNWPE